MDKLFITGMIRSGTTLVEKLLTNHKNIFIASQPIPFLYVRLKEKYNLDRGIPSNPYPVNSNYLSSFELSDFTRYLNEKIIDQEEIREILDSMHTYSGCYSKEIYDLINDYQADHLKGVYEQVCKTTLVNKKKDALKFIGTKEVLAEDYIEYFLGNNIRVVLVIRDPRDLIVSSNFSEAGNYVGENRPIPYLLRMWRKSVAYMIRFRSHPGFMYIKYEDLVNNTSEILNDVSGFLKIEPFDINALLQGVKDQYGKLWIGNSSFEKKEVIDSSSIGRYQHILDEKTVKYIETFCLPEMNYLGYGNDKRFDAETLGYNIDVNASRRTFPEQWYDVEAIKKEEIKRMKYLQNNISDADLIRNYFLFDVVYEELKKVME